MWNKMQIKYSNRTPIDDDDDVDDGALPIAKHTLY